MKVKGPGVGEQISDKMNHLKEKVLPNKDK